MYSSVAVSLNGVFEGEFLFLEGSLPYNSALFVLQLHIFEPWMCFAIIIV